jgi:hypothetical protein
MLMLMMMWMRRTLASRLSFVLDDVVALWYSIDDQIWRIFECFVSIPAHY